MNIFNKGKIMKDSKSILTAILILIFGLVVFTQCKSNEANAGNKMTCTDAGERIERCSNWEVVCYSRNGISCFKR